MGDTVRFEDGTELDEETGEVLDLGGSIASDVADAWNPSRVGDWRARDGESVGWSDAPAVHEWPTGRRVATPDAVELARWQDTPRPGVLADLLAEWPEPAELAPVTAPRRPLAERVARWVVPASLALVAVLFVVGTVTG
jgi:hypothetical protein